MKKLYLYDKNGQKIEPDYMEIRQEELHTPEWMTGNEWNCSFNGFREITAQESLAEYIYFHNEQLN